MKCGLCHSRFGKKYLASANNYIVKPYYITNVPEEWNYDWHGGLYYHNVISKDAPQ